MSRHAHRWGLYDHSSGLTEVMPTAEDSMAQQAGHTPGTSCVCKPWVDEDAAYIAGKPPLIVHRCLLGVCDTAERQITIQ